MGCNCACVLCEDWTKMLNLLFCFFLWYRWLHISHTFLIDPNNYVHIGICTYINTVIIYVCTKPSRNIHAQTCAHIYSSFKKLKWKVYFRNGKWSLPHIKFGGIIMQICDIIVLFRTKELFDGLSPHSLFKLSQSTKSFLGCIWEAETIWAKIKEHNSWFSCSQMST